MGTVRKSQLLLYRKRSWCVYWQWHDASLPSLHPDIPAQMQERRSAVSRQACHAVGELAAACGPAFEPLAVHLLPVVFKTLGMGINVSWMGGRSMRARGRGRWRPREEGRDGLPMLNPACTPTHSPTRQQVVSETADACAHAILAYCPSQRLLPKLCSVLADDRNARLRKSAAEYLLRALEGLHPAECERHLAAIERAVMAAASDAQAETRATARSLFAIFAHAWPVSAQAALARLALDRPLQERLAAAAAEYVPGAAEVVGRAPERGAPSDDECGLRGCSMLDASQAKQAIAAFPTFRPLQACPMASARHNLSAGAPRLATAGPPRPAVASPAPPRSLLPLAPVVECRRAREARFGWCQWSQS